MLDVILRYLATYLIARVSHLPTPWKVERPWNEVGNKSAIKSLAWSLDKEVSSLDSSGICTRKCPSLLGLTRNFERRA